jgi:thiamine-phosphate pyrophosphorylase
MSGIVRPRVILITDPAFGDDVIVRCVGLVAGALPRGWLCVQLRDKRRPRIGLRLLGWRLRLVTRAVGASLIINGDARLAREVGADGVHLGGDAGTVADARAVCGAHTWISVAAHSDDAVRAAVAGGADGVLVSPIFSTRGAFLPERTKPGRGVDALRSARAITGGRVALYALGGVTADNAGSCTEAGAHGVAVIRALLASAEPAVAARAIRDAVARRC